MNSNESSMNGQESASTLANGQTPHSPADVVALLDRLGVANSSISHPPMRTVKDSKAFRDGVPGGYSKNLFLRNKKGKMWLVTLHEDRVVDLRQLGELIGAGRVSFGSEQRLMKYLGVVPGAVTPLAVINDHANDVKAVLDAHLLTLSPLHFHPCDNGMTTTIEGDGLLKYMQECHELPEILDFNKLATEN